MYALVAKYGLRTITISVLAIALIAVLSFGQIRAKYYKWRLGNSQETAQAAKQEAATQTQRADTAETSNDIQTKATEASGRVQIDVVLPAERSAQRIEAKQNANPTAHDDPVDADVLRELDQADAAYTRATSKVQRARSR